MHALRLAAAVVATLCSVGATLVAGVVFVTKIGTFHVPDPTLYIVIWIAVAAVTWAGTRWLWEQARQEAVPKPHPSSGSW